ncbi:hypothetical protein TraAM80_04870 [Trypanosoma rangeli]|uniref:RRM domain-containing protein n=1 Tax=Trypanosoma rangeli TaxID=5698 RepID=A0A422NGV0_TRYRA|nr:uncharacterized protein TraAM80_04870 [Trypanosoma rangeli]RNF04674.1 hypothetical protein TraAM80_04870 [Trypanosoma rangeli]|eukprot:RNF04674.1 hypothetical protein TraAM80_04870 [Trypanosoma rangeli]
MPNATGHTVQLNPYAQDWAPEAFKAAALLPNRNSTAFPWFLDASACVGPNDTILGPGPVADAAPCAAADATENVVPSWFQRAWMEATQIYYYYYNYYNYLYQYSCCEADRERHRFCVAPPTVAAFREAQFPREGSTDSDVPAAGTDACTQTFPCNEVAPMHESKEHESFLPPFPHSHLLLGENIGDDKRIEACHRGTSTLPSCLLCGKDNHLYTACRLFDDKTVCFINTADFTVYAMRHDHWIERATLHDVHAFIRLAMGLVSQVLLQVGSQQLTLKDYPSGTRCCDLLILPGAVVGVSGFRPSLGPNTTPSPMANGLVTNQRQHAPLEDASDEEAAVMGDEALDVSTIGRTSELSVSLPLLEHHEGIRDDAATKNLTEGTICISEHEHTPVSNGSGTALPSPVSTRTDKVDLEVAHVSVVTQVDLTATPTVPDPVITKPLSLPPSPRDFSGVPEEHLDWEAVVRRDDHGNEQPVANTTAELTATEQAVDITVEHETPHVFPDTPETVAKPFDTDASRLRRTFHVRFLPVQMSFREIRTLLWSCGEVAKVRLVKPRATANPGRMFYVCFVEYATDKGAAKVKELHGHHVAGTFRLTVECSRNPILGGYVTDRDEHTGKPCTFGLSEGERLAVERRYVDVRGGDTGEVSDGGATKSSHQRGGQRRHSRECSKAPVTTTATAKEERYSMALRGRNDKIGPYALEIVAKDGRWRRVRLGAGRNRGDAVTGGGSGEASAALTSFAAVRARAAAAGLPPAVGRDVGGSCEQVLRERLCAATSCYVQCTTPRNFFEVLSVLEEGKWCSVTIMFRLFLARCEVALFFHHVLPRAFENAAMAATRVVHLSDTLTRLLTDVVANGGRVAPLWSSFFMPIPPSQQSLQVSRDNDQQSEELLESKKDVRHYPCFGKVLQFVELLLHITLLFDDFQCNCQREHGGRGTDGGALPTAHSAGASNGDDDIAQKLLACVRRLLVRLHTELASEGGGHLSPEAHVWHDKVSSMLHLLPPGPGWSSGSLLDALLPGRTQVAIAVLASQTELNLF